MKGLGLITQFATLAYSAFAEMGLHKNSVTPESLASTTLFFSECPVSMMIGTVGLLDESGLRIILVSSMPLNIGINQSVITMSG